MIEYELTCFYLNGYLSPDLSFWQQGYALPNQDNEFIFSKTSTFGQTPDYWPHSIPLFGLSNNGGLPRKITKTHPI